MEKSEGPLVRLTAITNKYVLLCEGAHDAEFFKALIDDRNLPGFTIASCGFATRLDGKDGISHLTGALEGITTLAGFEQVEAVLIVADNDSDGAATFAEIVDMVGAAEVSPGQPYIPPTAPLVKGAGVPSVVVMMLPWTDVNGALDTLCLAAAENQRHLLSGPVHAFAAAAQVDDAHGWPITKQHKMKLRSLISAAHAADPYISPAYVWKHGTDLVPVSDASFNQIADFIRDFPAFLAAP